MERQLDELGRILVEKLRTFNVQCELGGRTTGPVVTQFEIVPAPGVKVNRIANLDADLALAMKAQSVRIVAPIPGRGAVGVEIPNPTAEIVNLREILETPAFQGAKGELPVALGKDLNGRPYVANLAKMPHVLIAGATGSGKSVCVNTVVTSLVYKHTPETLRFLMIDPKMVELSVYARLPHLRHPVVTDPRDAAGVLKWAVMEMERRYVLMKVNHVRSVQEFNRKVKDGVVMRRVDPAGPEGDENRWIFSDGPMPYIVVVVDELADLMMTVQSEVEKPLTQLAQKARAIGIHLIVATQRPSVNVITGLIKANFPTRMAFRVASKTDSRTILDQNGADALLGNGDMLFLPPGQSEPVRIQGAFLPTEDTERLMAWYRELQERHGAAAAAPAPAAVLEPDILDEVRSRELVDAAEAADAIGGEWDELFRAAAEVCIQNGGGSTSLLQRRLSIGYGRAARIVDQLQEAGVLGPSEGAKGREVLMSLDELDAFLAGGDVG
jgi:S-DNA-T family DNA segregation ATPase FtsK/SpoIIIE